MIMSEPVLVHLHPDLRECLEDIFEVWNTAQRSWNFVGLRPRRAAERTLLIPGSISDDEVSSLAAEVRASAEYSPNCGIIVFTEKRLYDEDHYQLFVGGRETDEDPPRIGVLSLDFLRKVYSPDGPESLFFRAILSNILFSLGIDCGLEDHGEEVRGCIMDFCEYMPDIEFGLRNGPRFCEYCTDLLKRSDHNDLVRLAESLSLQSGLSLADAIVSESIILRGERYKDTAKRFDYDIALSFAGEDRQLAHRLAEILNSVGLAVFYDRFDQADLWGRNLHAYLTELYRLRARFCIVFLSVNYKRSRWAQVELEAALAREFKEGEGYILPIRLDNSEIAGILPTRAFLDWHEYSPDEIASIVREKLDREPTQVTAPNPGLQADPDGAA
jgi:predicted Zn-dependent protease